MTQCLHISIVDTTATAFLYGYIIMIMFIHMQQETLYARWNGMTALMLASKYGHTDTVKVLIAAGARVSVSHRIHEYNILYSICYTACLHSLRSWIILKWMDYNV